VRQRDIIDLLLFYYTSSNTFFSMYVCERVAKRGLEAVLQLGMWHLRR
jgi:hypothetical protein